VEPDAYIKALDALPRGSVVTIFTPDDTHFSIAMDVVTRGHHVLVTKPVVKTLKEHTKLHEAAEKAGVLVAVEVHKRWDPIYADARDRLRTYGDFSYLNAYMSQPKHQLETFRSWAGKSSDISYYLNSHHVDFSEWALEGVARPVMVTASAATGVGSAVLGREVEDTITLTVQWENLASGNTGVAVYTASWAAPPSDVHSQQRFFVMCHSGEVRVDQAHRGYTGSTDAAGFASHNPLFWKPTPCDGKFVGQGGYGYRSIEDFVKAARLIRAGKATPADFDGSLATAGECCNCSGALLVQLIRSCLCPSRMAPGNQECWCVCVAQPPLSRRQLFSRLDAAPWMMAGAPTSWCTPQLPLRAALPPLVPCAWSGHSDEASAERRREGGSVRLQATGSMVILMGTQTHRHTKTHAGTERRARPHCGLEAETTRASLLLESNHD
jgi:D-galacturonate reductase